MHTTEEHLKRIQEKVQLMLKQHLALQKENQSLKAELETMKKDTLQFKESSDKLRQQVEVLKYTHGGMADEDKKQFEKRINTYLKEIDRCIAMLGS